MSMLMFQYSILILSIISSYFVHCTTVAPIPKTVSKSCNDKGVLFQLMTATADPSASKYGTFAGYIKSRAACERHCIKKFKERCYEYMYEPNNRGTCTIFQYVTYGYSVNSLNSTASIYKKCYRMPPAVSTKCCGPLVQRHSTLSSSSDANMTVTYNDNTCRSNATVTCLERQGIEKDNVKFVLNEYMGFKAGKNSSPMLATCYNGTWKTSFYYIVSLECTSA